jgi:hypothetical protein
VPELYARSPARVGCAAGVVVGAGNGPHSDVPLGRCREESGMSFKTQIEKGRGSRCSKMRAGEHTRWEEACERATFRLVWLPRP